MSANKQSSPFFKPSEPSPWAEGTISIRKGSCNVLLIAPHGHPKNDEKTYDITRIAADQLDCYSIVTNTYRKPFKRKGSNKRQPPNKTKRRINLNRKDQVREHLKSEFEKPLRNIVDEIIETAGKALVIWIHGISDNNLPTSNSKANISDISALFGIGQGVPDRLTARNKTVKRIVSVIEANPHNPLRAALAAKGSNYCGWSENTMNQYFRTEDYSLQKVESIQIEIGKKGYRQEDTYQDTAMALANSLIGFARRLDTETEQTALDSAVQKGTIQKIKVSDIDSRNNQFMARIDDIKSRPTQFWDLVVSIKKNGILNNIIVRMQQSSHSKPYKLISGFRRMAALQEVLSKKELANATVPARVLSEGLSDDDAYRISFTENLARDDLSLWEIANACFKIKASMDDGSKSLGEIESHLSGLIQKGTRTVRRYLKLASIQDKNLIEAIHTGIITATDALEIGNKDIIQEDPKSISALLLHLKQNPKTTRKFEIFYHNLEYCCSLSGLSVAEVLECKYADKFLCLDNKILESRIEYLHQSSKKSYSDVLRCKAGSLIKNPEEIKDGLKKKQISNKFQQDYSSLVENVAKSFEQSNIAGKFKIKPNLNSSDNQVSVTITAPESQIWQAIDAVYDLKAKPNLSDTEKAKNKSKPRSPKQQNKSKKSDK